MMLSIDMVPIPTDEAVREVENRLLGVETNITNWQRRQNSNNNFSAVVPYDMELQRKESKEFLEDLTTRDQRMIFGILTMVITADTKDQLDADTDAILSTARKRMCQMAVLKYQQMDGLNTVLPMWFLKMSSPPPSSTPHGGSSENATLFPQQLPRMWNICWILFRPVPCFPTPNSLSC